MSSRLRKSAAARWPTTLSGLALSLATLSGCAKIVGIEDTPVTNDGNTGGDENASGASAGGAGSSKAGAANAGHGNGGSSASGGAAAAGEGTGGASVGTAGSGGAAAGSTSTGGNAGSAGGSQCPCSAPTPTCENGKCVVRGPTMAKAVDYYIDSTEVSKAQYDVFLAAKGTDTSGQIADCSWNTSYAPSGDPVDDPRPIVNVDWCDAAAYCAWADKRLCGAISGGPLAPTDLNDATKSQMYRACAGADGERYPYGGFTLMKGYCSFGDNMADVGTFPMCEGHYSGIFDLIGNAAEWLDSCDTAGGTDRSMDNCELGGGSYINEDYKCQTYLSNLRNDGADVFGFRCCSK